ncbi:hypothetical protein GCM10008013_43780 [Paenibacillus segetis]|uniref:Uncharacterized protein n=1 Tax=Paenibacillus segetis TaxID=1325360 RepID=A0ABQ1YU64_9BACL|nr:hypothetical protein GCM10008013_43780 [Paenibacillus segetis]
MLPCERTKNQAEAHMSAGEPPIGVKSQVCDKGIHLDPNPSANLVGYKGRDLLYEKYS